ncbi:hypothetical protein JCM19294_1193 [Nonlabens tegetincola]|uniref:Uncharacterized protein n=1 Tax=Nonlabens tegetincola TaxID=323273 RepID=A0A090Q1B4_9FLAO|nr:hypothetical protein JCM19294_1193 [Nonlabens tegetincola]
MLCLWCFRFRESELNLIRIVNNKLLLLLFITGVIISNESKNHAFN